MPDLTASTQSAVAGRWRGRLILVISVLGLFALVATVVAVAYDESMLTPLCLWLGLGALVLAIRTLPRAVAPGERSRMAVSAGWLVAGVVLYVVVPVLLSRQ